MLAAGAASGQGIITRLAGTASAACGTSLDGIPATSVQLCNAQMPVVDGLGNVYFYDANHRIRQVAPNGIITTIAGNGTQGTAGDGGPALSANLGFIGQLAWSSAPVAWNGGGTPVLGQLCFGDESAYKVRCVSLDTGTINGYGTGLTAYGGKGDGGPFSGATFNDPIAVTFDAAGNLYISDFSDSRVRKVDAVLGTISTFAGPGPGYCCAAVGDGGPATSGNLYEPWGLAAANGMLYIADTGNERVRQVNLSTNIITTVAGNGTYGYGATVNGSLATAVPVNTRWVATDNAGNLFLGAVQEVNAAGIINTIAGVQGYSGEGSDYIPALQIYFSGVNGAAWDPIAQRLLISDNDWVRQIYFTPPTATALTASQNPVQTSGTVTLQATVSPSTATGNVGFLTGYTGSNNYATLAGTAPLVNGVANYTWTAPASAGTQSLTAVYLGDPADNQSISTTISEAVQQGTPTTTTLTSSVNPSTPGQSVTFTATVTPAAATGAVTFNNGSVAMGSATLQNGVATFTTTTLPAGSSSIQAAYAGGGGYAGSSSAVLIQSGGGTATTTAVTSSANPSIAGGSVTFSAAVTPASATGTIQFLDGAVALGSATMAGGAASFSTAALASGTHSITAVYSGDANDLASTSAVLTQTVNAKTATTTVVTSSSNPSIVGANVTFSAAVSPATATGTVQFMDGATALTTVSLAGGAASFSSTTLAQGAHSITAVYSGDASDAVSTSAVLTQTVNAKTVTTTVVTSSANPSIVGANVTFSAAVTPATATGTVQFSDGTTALGSATLTGGVATFSTTALAVGTHSIAAAYYGDANNATSGSAILTQTVNANATTTGLASSVNPSLAGASVTFNAVVTPASATGTLQFLDGTTVLSTATLTGGAALFSTTSLVQGRHSITAVYSGDANNAASTSAVLAQMVSGVTTTSLVSSANPITGGASATFTATVAPSAATGTVQFTVYNSGNLMSSVSVPVSGGSAAWIASNLSSGVNTVTAIYSGDSNYASSTSAPVAEVVRFTDYTILTSNPNPSTAGGAVVLTATLAPPNSGQTGSVQFFNGATSLGSGTVNANGVAQLTTSALPAGADSLTAVYSGDGYWAPSTSTAIQQTVKAVTATTVTSSANPSIAGANVIFSAAISPSTATGTVQYLDGTTVLSTNTLAGGATAFGTPALAVGTHSITVVYSGDANNAASTSAVLTQTVNAKAVTATTVTSSANPATPVTVVTLSAAVSPTTATGTIQFFDGATLLGAPAIVNGAAAYSWTFAVGTHSITAVYSGDANNTASTSAVLTETINPRSTATTLTSALNPSAVGSSVVLAATVSSGAGTVQFFDGAASLGSATLASGTAQLVVTTFAQGVHLLTAVYSGDANDAASTSAVYTQTVKANANVNIASGPNPSVVGQTVTITATVAAAATGTVQFLDGGTVIGSAAVSGGSAKFTTSSLAQGAHTLNANYSGDSNYLNQLSTGITQTVKAATTTLVTSSANPSITGANVVFSATVSPASATGTVQFLDGATVLGTSPLSGGSASMVISTLAVGTHSITAVYSGDANNAASTSSVLSQVVNKTGTATTISSSLNPSTQGQAVTFTATVTPSTATGTVTFSGVGTATISGGVASITTSSLAVGTTTVTAQYGGDANDNASTSAGLAQVVKTATTTSLTSSVNPSTVGQSVTFTANLSPSAATGSVQFLDGTTVLATMTLSSGRATYAMTALAQGVHSITAWYEGSTSYGASTSAVLTQTVNAAAPGAPSGLTATAAGMNQINLAWTASATSGVTYNVYQSTTSGFTPSTSNLAASGVTSVSYPATGLTSATTYYFKVTAVNAGGASAATSQASATTAGVTSCHVAYSVTTQWNVGFGTAISIQNTGTSPISNWTLSWTWPGNQQITQSWNANYTQSRANAQLTYMSYDATVAPGATLSGVGFNGSYSGTNTAPTAFYVNGTLCH